MTVCGLQTADGGVDREPLQLLDKPKDPRRLDTRRVAQWVNEVTDEKHEPIMNILANAEPETESKSIRGPKNTVAQSHLGSSLISMGGDDITGREIMGLCRRREVFLHMQDFLKIANLWP
ncbi:nonribosomal peptide synthetase [Fusarium globosum]|uniref:Nonribosomal peptide synthetase n=1 Tax=Fusarium globosum TaxID=78864 RepID=A0A8H5XNF5_9HYPO|nr:nonribosomal peptide synthetase [Fusarium globosum]